MDRRIVAADRGLSYATAMSIRTNFAALALCAASLGAVSLGALAGCGSVKQQRPPRIPDEDPGMTDDMSDGGDIAAPEPETVERSEGET